LFVDLAGEVALTGRVLPCVAYATLALGVVNVNVKVVCVVLQTKVILALKHGNPLV